MPNVDLLHEQPPLKDIVLAILALSSQKGHARIPLAAFFSAFGDVAEHHHIPVTIARSPFSAYSKHLDDALQALLGYGVDLPNPQLQYLEVAPERAERHLSRLTDRYSEDWVQQLKPAADEFVSKVAALVAK